MPVKREREVNARTIRITSPAGHVHVFTGFLDDGEKTIEIVGLPEDEQGHWDPWYELTVSGQHLGTPEIEHG
jgi:hypothetical protein